jgi:methylated-DNA-[protein]-cysteine S-methyltransferase
MSIYTCRFETSIGNMRAAAENDAITGLWFEGQKYYPDTSKWIETKEYDVFKTLKIWLDEYFAGRKKTHNFTLSLAGTPFQMRVWNILADISYGHTTAYGKIAKELAHNGARVSSQAVGGAVGHNPISILIPCHRVIGADGTLTGYAGGLDKKRFLLELEGVEID